MPTEQLLVRLPEDQVRRFRRAVPSRERSLFVRHLLEQALPAAYGDDDPHYQAAREVERDPPPDQGDHCPWEEAVTHRLPALESQGCQRESGRRLCVWRQGSMGEAEPPGDDASLLPVPVRWTNEITQSHVARPSHTAGISPFGAGNLID